MPISTSPGAQRSPVDEALERDGAERRSRELEAAGGGVAADQLGEHRELAAGDLDAGELGAAREAERAIRASTSGSARSTAM